MISGRTNKAYLLIFLLFAFAVEANQWALPVEQTERIAPAQFSMIQTIETGDGTMWRLIIPEYSDHNYVYLERFDPSTGVLKNKSVYNFKRANRIFGSSARIMAAAQGTVIFSLHSYEREILQNLEQKDSNFLEELEPYSFVPKFSYRDTNQYTEVLDPVTNLVLRRIPNEAKKRLPQNQALAESGDLIFYAELFEAKNELIVLQSARRKNDGSLVWQKRLSSPLIHPIYSTIQSSGALLQLSVSAGTLVLVASVHRYDSSKSVLWALEAGSGDVTWEDSDTGAGYNSKISAISTSLGNLMIYRQVYSSLELRDKIGGLIRSIPHPSHLLPNGEFLSITSTGVEKVRELDGQVLWSNSRGSSSSLRPLCIRGDRLLFIEDLLAQSRSGYLSLSDGSEWSAQVPAIREATIAYSPYDSLNIARPCPPDLVISRLYRGTPHNTGIGFSDSGAELWRLRLLNVGDVYESVYSLNRGTFLSWAVYSQSPANTMYFFTPLSGDGTISSRFWGLASEIFESNSRHVKLLTTDSYNDRYELRQFRRDTDTSFALARLESFDARDVVDLLVKVVSKSVINAGPALVVRISNNSGVFAHGVRVTSDQSRMNFDCLPSPGASCRDGTGNKILSAEVDLPANGGYVDFKIQKTQFGRGADLVVIPGFDQLEKSPNNNWVRLGDYLLFDSFE